MSNEVLPEYSGTNSYCVKCRFKNARTEYHPSSPIYVMERTRIQGAPPRDEFLARECFNCGYMWAEATAS